MGGHIACFDGTTESSCDVRSQNAHSLVEVHPTSPRSALTTPSAETSQTSVRGKADTAIIKKTKSNQSKVSSGSRKRSVTQSEGSTLESVITVEPLHLSNGNDL